MSPHLLLILIISCCSLIVTLIFALRKKKKTLCQKSLEPQQREEIRELIKRYGFLKGKNLECFTAFLKNGELEKAEKLLAERFRRQQKQQPEKLARRTLEQLRNITI